MLIRIQSKFTKKVYFHFWVILYGLRSNHKHPSLIVLVTRPIFDQQAAYCKLFWKAKRKLVGSSVKNKSLSREIIETASQKVDDKNFMWQHL